MKHHPTTTANATAGTVLAVYITCALAVALFPDITLSIAQQWFHGLDISQITGPVRSFGATISGAITATFGSWLTGYLFATLYNLFLSKK